MRFQAIRPVLAGVSIGIVWLLVACSSSSDDVFDVCAGVTECDFVGQKVCMDDTHYGQCHANDDGCLVWDCST